MSSIAASLAVNRPVVKGPSCTFAPLWQKLDAVDREALESALRPDSGITGQQIADVLTEQGHPMKGHTVQRHRNGRCSCERTI